MKSYHTKRSETQDHFQPNCNFKEEWLREEDKNKYLKDRSKESKRMGYKSVIVAYEE